MNKKEANEYRRVQNAMKEKFNKQNIGDQTQYIDQTKLFKPLIEVQNESSKSIQDKIASSQDVFSNALIPFTTEMKRRNDQVDEVDEVEAFPFDNFPKEIEDVPQSTPKKKGFIVDTDFDQKFNVSDRENLVNLSLKLPSEVQIEGNFESVLNSVNKKIKSYGILASDKNKKSEREGLTEMYKSQKNTLMKYKNFITRIRDDNSDFAVKSVKGCRKQSLYKIKLGRGRPKQYPDTTLVTNADEIMDDLNILLASKNAGNTGVDNEINSALDALRKYNVINNDQYKIMYKNIFK